MNLGRNIYRVFILWTRVLIRHLKAFLMEIFFRKIDTQTRKKGYVTLTRPLAQNLVRKLTQTGN